MLVRIENFKDLWRLKVPSGLNELMSLSPIPPYTERGNVMSKSSSWFTALPCSNGDDNWSSKLPWRLKQSCSELGWSESQHAVETLGSENCFEFVVMVLVVVIMSSLSSKVDDDSSISF